LATKYTKAKYQMKRFYVPYVKYMPNPTGKELIIALEHDVPLAE
jgi:hypothetical protein